MDLPWAIAALRSSVALAYFAVVFPSPAQERESHGYFKSARDWANEPMVDVAKSCPSIFIELRYASERNLTGKPIYPANARCLVRRSVAQRLLQAQAELNAQGYALKIWDAYRPDWAQKILWRAVPNPEFLEPPSKAASTHTRGVAVDATLVTRDGRAVEMPTDFDDFTSAAHMDYAGRDPVVARNLRILQFAMGDAGFLGLHCEWWHFVARDYENSKPLDLDIQPGDDRNERLTRK